MSAEQLLAHIYADLDDDAPRLVYADWLEESGRPEQAELIRTQCALVRSELTIEERSVLRHRERLLLADYGWRWAWTVSPDMVEWQFERGFIESAGMDLADRALSAKLRHLQRHHPIRRLRHVPYEGDHVDALADSAEQLQHLEGLDLLGEGVTVNEQTRSFLGSPLPSQLKTLGAAITNDLVDWLTRSTVPKLQLLSVDCSPRERSYREATYALLLAIRDNVGLRLRELRIGSLTLTDDTLQLVEQVGTLPSPHQLETLVFSNCSATAQTWESFDQLADHLGCKVRLVNAKHRSGVSTHRMARSAFKSGNVTAVNSPIKRRVIWGWGNDPLLTWRGQSRPESREAHFVRALPYVQEKRWSDLETEECRWCADHFGHGAAQAVDEIDLSQWERCLSARLSQAGKRQSALRKAPIILQIVLGDSFASSLKVILVDPLPPYYPFAAQSKYWEDIELEVQVDVGVNPSFAPHCVQYLTTRMLCAFGRLTERLGFDACYVETHQSLDSEHSMGICVAGDSKY